MLRALVFVGCATSTTALQLGFSATTQVAHASLSRRVPVHAMTSTEVDDDFTPESAEGLPSTLSSTPAMTDPQSKTSEIICDFPGCDQNGRVLGGLAAIELFKWWPIKVN